MSEKIKRLKNPDAVILFNASEELEFLALLNHLAENDEWIDVNIKDLHLEVVPTKVSPVCLSMSLHGNYYPVFEEAMYSIKRRAENCARILKVMEPEDVAMVLNKSWGYIEKFRDKNTVGTGRALVREGNLLAIHSSRYVPFSQRQLNGSFANCLNDKYDEVTFKYGVYQHHITEVSYSIVDEALIDGYAKALNKAKYGIATSDIQLAATLRTSDTGMSSISIQPEFSLKGRKFIPFSEPLKIEHKDGAKFEDIRAKFEKVFTLIEDAAKHMEELLEIELTFPKSVLVQVCKKYKIPVTSAKLLEPQFKWHEENHTPMNAHDFYVTLCEIFYLDNFDELTEDRKLAVKDAVSKILATKKDEWHKLDVPGKDW